MPAAETRRGEDRGTDVRPRIAHRLLERQTARQPDRERRCQRTPGAVRVPRVDPHCHKESSATAEPLNTNSGGIERDQPVVATNCSSTTPLVLLDACAYPAACFFVISRRALIDND